MVEGGNHDDGAKLALTVQSGLISCNLVDKITADAAAKLIMDVSVWDSGSFLVWKSS